MEPDRASGLHAATWLRDRGWRPFPLDHPQLTTCAGLHHPQRNPCDGKRGKHPGVKFGTACEIEPGDKLLTTWFSAAGPRNVGVACGPSGLLVVDEDELDAFERFAAERGEAVPVTYRVRTARGWHWYFDATDHPELGNKEGLLREHEINIRGKGGFVVAAGSVHESGHVYTAEDDHVVPAPLPEWLVTVLRTRITEDGTEQAEESGRWTDAVRYGTEADLIGQYQRRVAAIQSKGNAFRTDELFPAARDGWRLVDLGLLSVDQMGADLRAAVARVWNAEPDERDRHIVNTEAREAARRSPWALSNLRRLNSRHLDEQGRDPADVNDEGPDSGDHPPSTWAPVDLAGLWDGTAEPRRPEFLARGDGVAMFYSGETHSVHGESESGKSWLVQTAVVERLRAGDAVLYVDFESTAAEVLPRLRALGMTRDQLGQLTYVTPDGPTDTMFAELLTRRYALAVIDGVTASMATLQTKSNSQDEVTAWDKALPRPIARWTGAAVVQVDHVSKAKDERGRFMIGNQAKMANLTGSAFYVDVSAGLGQGRTGELRVYVAKDRPGGVRAHAGKMRRDRLQPFARYIHDATDPTAIRVQVEQWMGDEDDDQMTGGGPLIPREGDWTDPDQAQLPDDVVAYTGQGARSILALARFMRASAVGGIGMTLADARAALGKVKGMDGKPVHHRDTVGRAWGALVDMKRIEPAESNTSCNPTGLHWWAVRTND